jgi:hypothetical protein
MAFCPVNPPQGSVENTGNSGPSPGVCNVDWRIGTMQHPKRRHPLAAWDETPPRISDPRAEAYLRPIENSPRMNFPKRVESKAHAGGWSHVYREDFRENR